MRQRCSRSLEALFIVGLSLACSTLEADCSAPAVTESRTPRSLATITASMDLTWEASARASTYDLYLGTSNPPPLLATGITATRYSANDLAPATTYYWYVVAHAECDPTRTSQSTIRSFIVAGTCTQPGAFALTGPPSAATEVMPNPTLSWSASASASSYDVYLGRSAPPTLYAAGLNQTSVVVPKLLPATTYHWRVVANAACDPNRRVATPVATFSVTQRCTAPSSPELVFLPKGQIAAGQTYAITWSEATGMDAGGSYIVERSVDSSFASIVDRQQTTSTSASFLSTTPGTYFHRVRSVAGCDGSRASTNSEAGSVSVAVGSPNVIFTVHPRSVITKLGDKLEDQKSSFTMENLGSSPVQVLVGRQELSSVPFFSIIDPLGGDAAFVTLEPRTPRTLELRFSGPASDKGGSYQGIVYLAATGQPFAINPLAYVNLKVGGEPSTAPAFLVNGIGSEYTFFPPASGDDTSRPSIVVDLLNSGTTPMELAAEIGPELWLQPEPGWNSTPIPANSFRPVRLFTRRNRAPNGSALPRYTYLTVRNRGGQSARILVQDNTTFTVSSGRTAPLPANEISYVLPTVLSTTTAAGERQFSRLRISNVGGDSVQTDLFFTPTDRDGFDQASVKRATILIPPNDIVNLSDPLAQLFGGSGVAHGQVEIRAAPEKIGLLTVSSSIETHLKGGGLYSVRVPALIRGEGARVGSPHVLPGLASSADLRTSVTIAETTGRDKAAVHLAVFNKGGAKQSEQRFEVLRYGRKQIELAQDGGRLELTVESGGGAVVGVASIMGTGNASGAALISEPLGSAPAISTLGRRVDPAIASESAPSAVAAVPQKFLIPSMLNGVAALGNQAGTYRTLVGFTATGDSASTVKLTYSDDSRRLLSKTITVPARQTVEYTNLIEELLALPSGTVSRGFLQVETDGNAKVHARLHTKLGNAVVGDALPVISLFSEALSGSGALKPLYADGIEQSIESTRGSRAILILNEVSGEPASVMARLYEAGNRTQPIAEKNIEIPARGEVRLDTLFSSLALDSEERRKDRTNVMVVVTPRSSRGLVSAVLLTIDNRTGETKHALLVPTGGVPATGVQRVGALEPSQPKRKRGARR